MPQEPENPEHIEALQKTLNDYKSAIEQEYTVSLESEPDEADAITRDFFKSHMKLFAAQIVWLAENADSESVKLNASKFGLAIAMEDAKKDGDPVADLLKGLAKNDKKQGSKTPI